MYLFFRSARLGPGSAHEQMAWSVSITEKVNQISESKVNLWTTFMSPGVNTLVWTTVVDDLAVLEATNDKLMADSGYHMLLEQGARYDSGEAIDDGLMQYVYAEGVDPNEAPAYVVRIQAALAPGQGAKGVELGVEIAQTAARISGLPVQFAMATTGVYGGVEWHAGYSSIQELQRAGETLNAHAEFMDLLDKKAKDAYQPAATQVIYRRIA